jgi:hypothetical protein
MEWFDIVDQDTGETVASETDIGNAMELHMVLCEMGRNVRVVVRDQEQES